MIDQIKNILFDLDGTLIEPREGILNSIDYALAKMGISENQPEELISFIGPPLIDSFIQRYKLNDQQALEAVNHYRDFFREKGIHQNQVYEGIMDLLSNLKDLEFNLFVATSKPTQFAKQILDYFKLSGFFSEIVGSTLDNSRREKKDIIKLILDTHSLEAERSIMVGDRNFDILGAKENSMSSVGVTYGYGSFHELEQAGADFIVFSTEELKAFFQQ